MGNLDRDVPIVEPKSSRNLGMCSAVGCHNRETREQRDHAD